MVVGAEIGSFGTEILQKAFAPVVSFVPDFVAVAETRRDDELFYELLAPNRCVSHVYEVFCVSGFLPPSGRVYLLWAFVLNTTD